MLHTYFTVDNRTSQIPTGSNAHAINLEEVEFDTMYITLPEYFVNSPNQNKSISILVVRLFDLTDTVHDSPDHQITATMHSDIVQVNSSADNYCVATNIAYPHPKKYVLPTAQQQFQVWFRRMDGTIIDVTPSETRVIIEMELEY